MTLDLDPPIGAVALVPNGTGTDEQVSSAQSCSAYAYGAEHDLPERYFR